MAEHLTAPRAGSMARGPEMGGHVTPPPEEEEEEEEQDKEERREGRKEGGAGRTLWIQT